MAVLINSEQQLTRINQLEYQLNYLFGLSAEELTQKPTAKSWNALEVLQHLSISHVIYQPKVVKALANNTSKKPVHGMKASFIASWMIEKVRPQENGERVMKMKTMVMFQPKGYHKKEEILQEFTTCLHELKLWVTAYKKEPVSMKRFNSAIGPLVRFNLPEACEFLLCHCERHFVQIGTILPEVSIFK